jgi:hypothetical protein
MSDLADSITPPPAAASAVAPGTPDRKGHPFDPARHIPKMSKAGGTWIPKSPGRGGNKPKSAGCARDLFALPSRLPRRHDG